MRVLLAALGGLLAAFVPFFTPPNHVTATYYVGPSGSDTTGDGSLGNPWATLPHACATVPSPPDTTIKMLAGTYLGVSWTINQACSGSSGHPLTITANGGVGTVFMVGGQKVTTSGCTISSGSVYKCPVPGTAAFWTVFEGGVRLQLARSPNIVVNGSFPQALEPNFAMVNGSYTTIVYNPVDIDPSTWTDPTIEVFHWEGGGTVGHIQWFSGTNPVLSVNTGTHTLTFANKFKYEAGNAGNGYVVENDLSFLDAQGEWYLDRSDVHGAAPGGQHYLYVWPLSTPITGETIYYPTTQDTLTIAGASDSTPVHDITISNVDISVSDFGSDYRYATWGTGANGDFDPAVCIYGLNDCGMAFEAAQPNAQHGLVHITSAHDITLTRDYIHDSGYSALYAQNMAYNLTISDNKFEHCGYDGVQLEGRWCGQGDVNNHSVVTDNKIWNVGELVGHGAGVRLANSGHDTVSHNDFRRGLRDAIYVTDFETPGMFDGYGIGNLITYNFVTGFGQDSADMGCIGVFALGSEPTTSPPYRTNTISQNIVDNCNTHPTVAAFDGAPNCYFTDNQTHGQIISDNSCTNLTESQAAIRANDSGNVTSGNGTIDHNVWDCCTTAQGQDSTHVGLTGSNPY